MLVRGVITDEVHYQLYVTFLDFSNELDSIVQDSLRWVDGLIVWAS